MNLYLHIGTEKTGSSHLQSIAAINRDRLKKEGIWFPEAGKREDQLVKGRISAGNAQNITDALNTGDLEACRKILIHHVAKAKEYDCQTVLLSNELLVLALANDNTLHPFILTLESCGFATSSYLLILRDPVEQALSLYKHRAKSGRAPDIEDWPHQQYYYSNGLLCFLKEADDKEIDLTCRKYSKERGALEEILFKDWMGLDIDLTPPPKAVNPSLSLSELVLIKKVRRHQAYLANILYERLLAVSKDQKAEHTSIEDYHRNILSDYLAQYEETWKACNAQLPVSEKISYPAKVDKKQEKHEKISSFSEVQMDKISGIIADSLSFRFKLQVLSLKWRRRFGKLKNRLLN